MVNGDRKQPGLEQGTNWGQNTRDTKGLSSYSRLGVSERCQGLCCQALPLPPGLGCLYIALDLKLLEFVGNGILGLCPLRFVTEDEFNYVTLILMALSPCTYLVICYQPF